MNTTLRIFALCIASLLLAACPGTFEPPETVYTPIYMSYDELESAIFIEPPRSLQQTGKIYRYQQYILMNERYRGVHIFDNSDPGNPIPKGFINIPGNIDIAIKNNVLYADSAIDLVAIDLTNPLQIQVSKRINEVFPVMIPPDNGFFFYEESKGVIVGWELQ